MKGVIFNRYNSLGRFQRANTDQLITVADYDATLFFAAFSLTSYPSNFQSGSILFRTAFAAAIAPGPIFLDS